MNYPTFKEWLKESSAFTRARRNMILGLGPESGNLISHSRSTDPFLGERKKYKKKRKKKKHNGK